MDKEDLLKNDLLKHLIASQDFNKRQQAPLKNLPNVVADFVSSIPKDYKLQELREQTKIQENTLDEQKRQSDIMEIWGKMMEKQTELMTRQIEIQEKQSQENDKVAKNNKFLGWIVGIATVFGVIATNMQAVIAYLDYKKAIRVNPPIAIEQSQQFANGRRKTNKKFCEFANTVELMKLM